MTAEEAFFADNSRYGSVAELMGADYWYPTTGVTTEQISLTSLGYAVTATHPEANAVCGVFVGTANPPHPSLTFEGDVACW